MLLSSEGAAEAGGLAGTGGCVVPGADADIVVLDLSSTPAIAQRQRHAENFWDTLFATIMMGDDRAVHTVWIAGQEHIGAEKPQ